MSTEKKDNYLEVVYKRNESMEWKEEEDGTVTVTRENTGKVNGIMQKLFKAPKVSQIHFEKLGSFIWKQLDGKKNIKEIGEAVHEEFGDRAEPLYERLTQFIESLVKASFVEEVK